MMTHGANKQQNERATQSAHGTMLLSVIREQPKSTKIHHRDTHDACIQVRKTRFDLNMAQHGLKSYLFDNLCLVSATSDSVPYENLSQVFLKPGPSHTALTWRPEYQRPILLSTRRRVQLNEEHAIAGDHRNPLTHHLVSPIQNHAD